VTKASLRLLETTALRLNEGNFSPTVNMPILLLKINDAV
jgi:hypothetical protein